jgi:hypothetical protein
MNLKGVICAAVISAALPLAAEPPEGSIPTTTILPACEHPLRLSIDPDEWQLLFDGATLDGWVSRGGQAEYIVEDGAIVGRTRPDQPNTFLCTERDFDDFVLTLQFMVDPDLNSGVQIRSHSNPEYQRGRVHGYQVEIDPSARAWTGRIYDEGRRAWIEDGSQRVLRQDGIALRSGQWNRMVVVAKGPHIHTWINDEPVTCFTDDMTASGFIALQVHGVGPRQDALEVRWKDIAIKPLLTSPEAQPSHESTDPARAEPPSR